jgi:predicted glycosyltransferase involved in capsule biosynthesis
MPRATIAIKIYTLPTLVCDIKGFLSKNTQVFVSQKMKGAKHKSIKTIIPIGKSIFIFKFRPIYGLNKNNTTGITADSLVQAIIPQSTIIKMNCFSIVNFFLYIKSNIANTRIPLLKESLRTKTSHQ